MIKKVILFGLLGLFNLNILQAQNNNPEIKVDLEDFDVENLTNSERILLNILVQRSVKTLEKEIEQLNADREFGRITEEEYQERKQMASDEIADKIGRSIDILTDAENYTYESEINSDFRDTLKLDNIDFEYKKEDNKRSISIRFDNEHESDSTETDKKRIHKYRDAFHFGMGFTNWLTDDNERFDDPEKKLSGGSSLYYEFGIRSSTYLGKENPNRDFKYRSRTSFDYGFTLISRYYHFNNKMFSINQADNGISEIENVQATKSVFSQTSLEVPISLTHHFGKKVRSSFTVSAGLYGGVHLRSRQKIKYSVNNEDYKAKWISDFNSNRFYAGAQASVGFSSVYLTARYNFSKLFKSSSDIEVYPYTIGLSIEL